MSASAKSTTTTKDLILAHLRHQKIKLWLPPYHNLPTQGGGTNNDAMLKLAESLQKKLFVSTSSSSTTNGNYSSNGGSATVVDIHSILGELIELQSHAVQKLKEKNSLDIKILATKQHLAFLNNQASSTNTCGASSAIPKNAAALFPTTWGDEVVVSTTQQQTNNKSLHVHVTNLSPQLTVDEFSLDVCRALNAKTVRVLWKGKNLVSGRSSGNCTDDEEGDTLRKIVLVPAKGNAATSTIAGQKKKSELLCLVSGYGFVPPSPVVAAAAASVSNNGSSSNNDSDPTESETIQSIREAAHTIQNSSRQRFEITDQSGNLVPMHQGDMVAFLTALGLHRIGRSKMGTKHDVFALTDVATAANNIANGDGDVEGRKDDIASALVFLLEADSEWSNSPALENWKEKVDNYGLLQMDIAWCYLLLESLDNLTDAVRRLDIAEKVLRKQVHTNFVTLAVAQAEMEHQIPPLCAIFVRLFLLQGVANKIQNCNATAAERLGWAQLLCNRLRSASPPDSVDTLCNAYLVDPATAIAALRRSNGDPDAAGNFITQDRNEERQAARKRRRQHKIGKCANKTDFVNIDLVPALAGLLGYGDDVTNNINSINQSNDDAASVNDLHTSTLIVIGLLRLSNNDIEQSLELYNSISADQILERVAKLDEAFGRKKRSQSTRKPTQYEVKDVDLTMLISMGVDEKRSRDALKATGNVESALLWLSKDDDVVMNTGNDEANDATSASDHSIEGNAGGDDTNKELITESKSESDEGKDSLAQNKSESDDSDSTSDTEETDIDDAFELLERELGNALGSESKQLLEKEWLGVDLLEESEMIEKYI